MVGATEALAQAVAYLTGAGVIEPTDPPLATPSEVGDVELPSRFDASALLG